MVSTIDPDTEPGEVPPALSAPGSAVLALGDDVHGAAAVAVWQVSPDGRPTGAWVLPQDRAFGDRDTARRLLTVIERRALTAGASAEVGQLVAELTGAAGVDRDGWWGAQAFSAPTVFAEMVARRSELEATVTSIRQGGQNVTPLEWTREFPATQLPERLDDLRELAQLGVADGAPVVSEARTVARTLRWLVEVWAETEQVKGRRSYLKDTHGAAQALPPSWLRAVTTAGANRLPL